MKEEIKDDLIYKIIGCAMKVHSILGNGFQEVIYQRSLDIEMKKQKLKFSRELEMFLFYDEINIGSRSVDFLVEEKIMVELKAVIKLEDLHLAQGLNYLVAYKADIGSLLNFGLPNHEVKRLKHPLNRKQLNA
jgi:GxxExxY protein